MSKRTVSIAGKELLVNTIISVNHQNRRRESKECWSRLNQKREGVKRARRPSPEARRKSDCVNRELSVEEGPSDSWDHNRFKEGPSDRWDHNGFKELYPQEAPNRSPPPVNLSNSSSDQTSDSMPSSSDSSSSEDERGKKRKRRKRSRSRDDEKKSRRKSKKKKRRHKKQKS